VKNNYRKLKLSILLQTIFVTACTALVGLFLLVYVGGGFGDTFVDFLGYFAISEETATSLYWSLIGNNRPFFLIIGFLLLFSIFFYAALSRMVKYLDRVGEGIDNIISDSEEPVKLITELQPIEVRLNEIKASLKNQKSEALEGEKRKNDLVVFLAHDLKTPLTSIVAYLSMLETHPDMSLEERARYIHISLEKAMRLGELINEFFEITRYNLQDIILEPTSLDLSMMLEQLADELYGVLQEKNLTCEVDVEENLEVSADADKLARVFDNLLRNAIAYCDEATMIKIGAKEVEKDIQIIFENRGQPIPEEELETIFEKFYRGDGSRSSTTGGAGLGLSIAMEIVQLHKGKIEAKSNGDITQFIVTLPKICEEKK